MQFTMGMKGLCSPPVSVKVEVYNTYKPILIAIKKFFQFPKRFSYTFTVIDKAVCPF